MTADERTLQAVQPLVASFLDALPARSSPEAAWAASLPRLNEAITVPTQVCCLSSSSPSEEPVPSLAEGEMSLLSKLVPADWLCQVITGVVE